MSVGYTCAIWILLTRHIFSYFFTFLYQSFALTFYKTVLYSTMIQHLDFCIWSEQLNITRCDVLVTKLYKMCILNNFSCSVPGTTGILFVQASFNGLISMCGPCIENVYLTVQRLRKTAWGEVCYFLCFQACGFYLMDSKTVIKIL